jgi:hypothetical protein
MSTILQWQGQDTPAEFFLTLLRATGPGPLMAPALGAQQDGTLRFRDVTGAVVIARPGDYIEVVDGGWRLATPTDRSEPS